MTTQTPTTAPTPVFTPSEWQALQALRARYQQDRDLLTGTELTRLRFVRWLYQAGRLVP